MCVTPNDCVLLDAAADSDDDTDSIASGVDDNFGQEGDSIFVRNLPNAVKFNEVFDLFAKVGQIRVYLSY